jgi:hypothetical protein
MMKYAVLGVDECAETENFYPAMTFERAAGIFSILERDDFLRNYFTEIGISSYASPSAVHEDDLFKEWYRRGVFLASLLSPKRHDISYTQLCVIVDKLIELLGGTLFAWGVTYPDYPTIQADEREFECLRIFLYQLGSKMVNDNPYRKNLSPVITDAPIVEESCGA